MVSDLNTLLVIKAILAITLPELMLLDPNQNFKGRAIRWFYMG